MSFNRENYDYRKFNIDNHKIEFDVCGENGILISIPFKYDTPQSIKDKLNNIICQSIEEWSKEKTDIDIPKIEKLLLCAEMEILCHNDERCD